MAGAAGTASVAIPDVPDARYRAAGTFEIKILDEVISDYRLPTPDFIKIDVEGAELEVLRGAEATLTGAKPDLFVELHGTGPQGKAEAAEALLEFLTQCGYTAIHVESAAKLAMGSYLPGEGHWLCTSRARRHAAKAAALTETAAVA